MKLRDLNSSPNIDNIPKETEQPLALTFNIGDKLTLKKEFENYNNNHSKIIGKTLIVKRCSISDLGDMNIEVIYFNQADNVENPYLAEHFRKV